MRDMVVLLGAETPSGRAVAKKLRGEHYCCVLMRSDASAAHVRALEPSGIVIAGEASDGAKPPDPGLLTLGLPILSLGSASQTLLEAVAVSEGSSTAAENQVLPVSYANIPLFEGMASGERWISSARAYDVPRPYQVIADGGIVPVAYGSPEDHIYLLQFQIERNDPEGTAILRTFAKDACGCSPWWTAGNIVDAAIERIKSAAGDGFAICAMSGGLDSTVAAVLTRQAIGERARFIFVDTGLLRQGEANDTEVAIREGIGLNVERIDISDQILHALKGVVSMQEKWRVVEQAIASVLSRTGEHTDASPLYIKGTNYVDVLEEAEESGDEGRAREIAPLRELFKEEIRDLGVALNLPEEMLGRQPFPGMGLAARICGEVTAERLRVLRHADYLFAEEILHTGQEKRLRRYFAILDESSGQREIILRALVGTEPHMTAARLPYDLLERCIERIRKELPSVDRVLYDMTPGMAEWPMQG